MANSATVTHAERSMRPAVDRILESAIYTTIKHTAVLCSCRRPIHVEDCANIQCLMEQFTLTTSAKSDF
ncbi:MAG: hypothetical protein CL930_01980 [Deltaproteobacteria bacterium]|nr:hypothetical protein [Deltaproteobacteria bacterium]